MVEYASEIDRVANGESGKTPAPRAAADTIVTAAGRAGVRELMRNANHSSWLAAVVVSIAFLAPAVEVSGQRPSCDVPVQEILTQLRSGSFEVRQGSALLAIDVLGQREGPLPSARLDSLANGLVLLALRGNGRPEIVTAFVTAVVEGATEQSLDSAR